MKTLSLAQEKGNPGIVTDGNPIEVPWADGNNVRLKPGGIYKTPGKELLATTPAARPVRAIFAVKGHDSVLRHIVCCDEKVYAYTDDFASYTDITPTPAPSGTSALWQFTVIGGLPVLTNGLTRAWQWTSYSGVLTTLTNAPAIARRMTHHLGKIVVGNVRDGANDYKGRVEWCKTDAPTVWPSPTAKTECGGYQDLLKEGAGLDAWEEVMSFLHVTGKMYVLTERGIFRAVEADWPVEYAFHQIESQRGALSGGGVVSTPGGGYICGREDFYHLGDGLRALGINRVRDRVFNNLNVAAAHKVFSFHEPNMEEVWFCYPSGANVSPNTAAIYNARVDGWTFCDVDFSCHALSWEATGAESLPYSIVGTASGKILKLDSGNQNNGSAIEAWLQTGDLIAGSAHANKMIAEVRPLMAAQDDQSILTVRVGCRNRIGDNIRWTEEKPFTIGITDKVNFRKQGKFFRLEFRSRALNSPWELNGYEIDYILGGTR